MKKVVFITTHIAAKAEVLTHSLNLNERIDIQNTYTEYVHPTDLHKLLQKPHKCRSSAAIYGDHIFHNINFQCKRLHDICTFIYVIRGAQSLKEMFIGQSNIKSAYSYYCFRIRRIYEMAKRTPNSFLITHQDMSKKVTYELLQDFLKLKTPLIMPQGDMLTGPKREIPIDILEKSQDCFEYYLYKLRNIPHLKHVNQNHI